MSIDRRFLDVRLCVRGTANTPAEVKPGIQYIVGAAPSGAFAAAKQNDIAVYDGYKSAWKFYTPAEDHIELMNVEVGKWVRWNGTAYEEFADIGGSTGEVFPDPVENIAAFGTSLPGVCQVGDVFLHTGLKQVYTATGENTWDGGSPVAENDRYASSTDFKIYTLKSGVLTATDELEDGALFLVRAGGGKLYCYDKGSNSYVLASGGATEIPDATYAEKGKVVIDQEGGLKVEAGKLSVKRRTITVSHELTADEVDACSFPLEYRVVDGAERQVGVSVCGVAQTPRVDYEVSNEPGGGSTIDWNGMGLADIALAEGDVFVLTYSTDDEL